MRWMTWSVAAHRSAEGDAAVLQSVLAPQSSAVSPLRPPSQLAGIGTVQVSGSRRKEVCLAAGCRSGEELEAEAALVSAEAAAVEVLAAMLVVNLRSDSVL